MSSSTNAKCIICCFPITKKQLKCKQISNLQLEGLSSLLRMAKNKANVGLFERLNNITLETDKVCYHRACYKKHMICFKCKDNEIVRENANFQSFVSIDCPVDCESPQRSVTLPVWRMNGEIPCSQSLEEIESPLCLSPQHPVTTLPIWSVDQCGSTHSHAEYLNKVAQCNGLTILETMGGGHCFYNSVELCLRELGMSYNIWQLRAITADQLIIDKDIHAPVYRADNPDDRGQYVQARTYDAFVSRSRAGSEWATESCVYSLAKALNIAIRVISTLDINNQRVSAMTRDYVDGVTSNSFIAVGYNKCSEHYVGIGRGHRVPHSQTQTVPTNYSMEQVRRVQKTQAVGLEQRHHSLVSQDQVDIHIGRTHAQVAIPCLLSDVEEALSCDDTIVMSVFQNSDNINKSNASAMHTDTINTNTDHYYTEMRECTPLNNDTDVVTCTLPNEAKCCNCKRQETDKCSLNLLTCAGRLTKRRYCNLTAAQCRDSVTLCSDCRLFLKVSPSTNKDLWSHGWPSVLTYLLINKSDIRHSLWRYLSSVHRISLASLAIDLNLSTDLYCVFVDYTRDVSELETRIKSGIISDFLLVMRTTSFPCVKCPAGCFEYMEKCTAIPFNHFLAWKFGISIHDGKSGCFTGARQDWPSSSLQLNKFQVYPGLIVNERGLCVMLCDSHGKGLMKPIIHVPVNPILKEGLPYPDMDAAATLQPNVIRKGQMGTWTNSNHVVRAVGGYTGISSSSIAMKIDSGVKDERLAMSTALAMCHRPDIANVVRKRFGEMREGEEELKRLERYYNNYCKPSDEEIAVCLGSGNYVHAFDAFSLNRRVRNRDTQDLSQSVAARPLKKINVSSLMLIIVHPENDFGHVPVRIFEHSKQDMPVFARLFGELLVHCPYLYSVVLDVVDVGNSNSYSLKLAQFVQQCGDSGLNDRRNSLLKRAMAFDELTRSELIERGITCSVMYCRALSELLTCMCPDDIFAHGIQSKSSISRVQYPCSAKVLMLYRVSKSKFRNGLPLCIGDHHLLAVFSKDEYVFRWNEKLQFWKVEYTDKCYTTSKLEKLVDDCSVLEAVPYWNLAVYCKGVDYEYVDACLTANIGEQKILRCPLHDKFLVKQPISCELACCVKLCAKKSRWRCLAGGNYCEHGVCFSHGKKFIEEGVVVDIRFDNDDFDESDDLVAGQSAAIVQSVQPDMIDVDSEHDSEHENTFFVPIGQETAYDCDDLPANHSRKDMVPIYNVHNSMSGHYLWNQGYGVLNRKNALGTNTQANAMLQHIVASTNNASVSLLYPEGQLFPRIFYACRENSVIGALPSFMLNADVSFLAPAAEHYLIRMKDGDLLTSKEYIYWHYLFDIKLNSKLTHDSSTLVFKRGFEFLLEKDSLKSGECIKHLTNLPMGEFESVRRVKELSCLLKKGCWSYFMTLTCNDMHTPGIAEITQAIKEFSNDDDARLVELTDSYLPFILRAWERFVRLFVQELLLRNDTIIGKVQNLFGRFEWQGANSPGNKCHFHCGITLAPEPIEVTTGRICCASSEFHGPLYGTDYETLLQLGVVRDKHDFDSWCDIVACVNHHDCNRAGGRCRKATNVEGDKVCRYRRQPPFHESPPGNLGAWFTPINVPYPAEVYSLLQEMGLARREQEPWYEPEHWVLHEFLTAGQWNYRAHPDEFFLASIPLVSAIFRSSTNFLKTDFSFQSSYLVKYVCGAEERNLVSVSGTKDINDVIVTTEEHAHEKITNCARILQKKEKQNPHLGREVSLSECVWFDLNLSYTTCSSEFIHCPTLPIENRAAVLLRHKHSGEFVNSDDGSVIPVTMRTLAQLPRWRQFTEMQEAHIIEYRNSAYSIDTTSAFNIRPPELLVFNELQLYHECFTVLKVVKYAVSSDVASQKWIDGAGRLVKLRSCSVAKAIAFLARKSAEVCEIADILLQEIFLPIQQGVLELVELFVHHINTREVVAVISSVKPWDRCKFLTHLCLSLGRYDTEFDLFKSGSIKDAFVTAGLLPSVRDPSRVDVLNILRRYVLTDLAFQSIPARQFARYLIAAFDTLNAVLIDGVIGDYTPCLSEVMLKEQATAQVVQVEQTRRQQLVNGLFDDSAVCEQLPADLFDASLSSPLTWTPQILPVDLLSPESLQEQSAALAHCIDAIDQFMDPLCRGVRFPCLVGRPGSGKSHVLKLACSYALAKGLQCEMISWTSHRSRVLGGRHLHLCFPLPVNQGVLYLADGIAAECIRSLDKDPLKKSVIIRTDVFFFEEIGLLSAEYFSALDTVLRMLMKNSQPWGGKLLISSGDSHQLPPIAGRPLWASANMATVMRVVLFKTDVRAADPILRWLNDECRSSLDSAQCSVVANAILDNCSSAPNWDAVPEDAVRIVPTKAAERSVIDTFLATQNTRSFVAIDEVLNRSVWARANQRITRRLNRDCYEYDNCRLYIRAIVCMTYNERRKAVQFSQGQLAVVVELPVESTDFLNCRIKLRLAPPGFNRIDTNNIPDDWPEFTVKPRCTAPIVVGPCYQMGRRTQFPIRYHLTSTIHRIQGETVSLYATQICESAREYRLWQKEQLTVLISRARYCRDIIFVGSRQDTLAGIKRVLGMHSKWDLLVDEYVTALDVMTRPPVRQIRLQLHPFLPLYRELPTTTCGYVYLIVSIPYPKRCYIGQCDNLKKALREHNTGHGPVETRSTTLHPWGVFGFVCGFDNEVLEHGKEWRDAFCFEWQNSNDINHGPETTYNRGVEIVAEWISRANYNLVIVKCADVP